MTLLSPILLHFLGAFRTGTAFLVLAVQNPVHALLLLIRLFSLGTLFLFTLQREYFAILFLIVYVGAIVVLFLFLIRRLELKRLNGSLRLRDLLSSRYRVVLLLVLELLLLLDSDRAVDVSAFYTGPISDSRNPFFDWSTSLQHTGPVQAFGALLYTEYKVAFLLAAALLLLSRVGALVLTLVLLPSAETSSGAESYESFTRKRQDRNSQARRHPSFAPRLVRSAFLSVRAPLVASIQSTTISRQIVDSTPPLPILLSMSVYPNRVRNPLLATISNHLDGYPTPINLSYLWGFGSLAGIALGVQIVTGVCLARHYAPEIHLAFASVEHIRRDVQGGVALRYVHANGASRFFILVYTHRLRGLYYGSYFQPRANLWYSGVVIFILRRATAFRGYVLPWGQRSFWGATVITNLFSAIPQVGDSIVQLLWGGFSVDNPTLNRFFSLHYLFPFVTAARALLHLVLLHQHGSTNPLGITSICERIPFYPYFYVKDLFGFFLFVLFFSFFVVYAPNRLGHPDNYIEANPLVTPAHIVPEWYFLPFYAILRTIPDKLGGVLLRGAALVVLAFLPLVDTSALRSTFFKPFHLFLFWFFLRDALSLGWIGQEIVESPFIERANFVTTTYFAYFLPLLPFLGFLETSLIHRALNISAGYESDGVSLRLWLVWWLIISISFMCFW